jgi:hypothetical protein
MIEEPDRHRPFMPVAKLRATLRPRHPDGRVVHDQLVAGERPSGGHLALDLLNLSAIEWDASLVLAEPLRVRGNLEPRDGRRAPVGLDGQVELDDLAGITRRQEIETAARFKRGVQVRVYRTRHGVEWSWNERGDFTRDSPYGCPRMTSNPETVSAPRRRRSQCEINHHIPLAPPLTPVCKQG